MATYYVRTDGNNANAGTSDTAGGAWLTIAHAMSQVAAGDTVYVRGTAGTAASYPTSSPDFTIGTYINTPTAGTAAGGLIRWIGLGNVPVISVPGVAIYSSHYHYFEGLYFYCAGNTFGDNGVIRGDGISIVNCTFNLNNQSNQGGVYLGSHGEMVGGEIYGGTASPSSGGTYPAIRVQSYSAIVQGVRVRNHRHNGIAFGDSGGTVLNCLIHGCAGDGVVVESTNLGVTGLLSGNTIHGNAGHGINLDAANAAEMFSVRNNNVTNHTQSGKSGIRTATSSSDIRKRVWGWNNVWNNTTNYTNVTADSTDLSVDPGYIDAANGDFTPSNQILKGAAFPTEFISQ